MKTPIIKSKHKMFSISFFSGSVFSQNISKFLIMKHSIDLSTKEAIEENDSTVNTTTNQMYTSNNITTAGDVAKNTELIDTMHNNTNQKKSKLNAWYNFIMGDIYATDDPNLYSESRKNVIIMLVALSGIAGPMSSMMYMPGILAVVEDLHTTTSAVNGTISAFVVFMGISVSLCSYNMSFY